MLKYYKLFDLLNRRGMKKTDLLEIISAPTIAKLSKGDIVKSDIIDKICTFLECQPGDIMEHIVQSSELPHNKGIQSQIKNEIYRFSEDDEMSVKKEEIVIIDKKNNTKEVLSKNIIIDDEL